jgi:S1-C subfamily serine protease
MSGGLPLLFSRLSDAVTALVAAAAPSLAAIRIGPNRHITGIAWGGDRLITADQLLPMQDAYTVVLPDGAIVPARPGPRDPACNLALLLMDAAETRPVLAAGHIPDVGDLVLVLTADFDARPTMRLAAVHRLARGPTGEVASIVLDLPNEKAGQGGAVLDARGRLIGMAGAGPGGDAIALPYQSMARLPAPAAADRLRAVARPGPGEGAGAQPGEAPPPGPKPALARRVLRADGSRRGWLGVALQPITVPEPLVPRAGQGSGRMVVNITPGGPADKAGLHIGDVLLALDGYSASGPHALRAFLGAESIGARIEVRLLRDGAIQTAHLTVAEQPGD